MHMIQNIFLISIIVPAAYCDIRTKRIPNLIILTGLIAGLGLAVTLNGVLGILPNILGFLLGILILFIPFAMGGIGAGDVKLLGAIGAIKGPEFVFYAFLYSAVWGGIISLILLCYKKQLLHILKWIGILFKQIFWVVLTRGKHPFGVSPLPSAKISLPYAVPILLGAVTILLMEVVL